jgi:hypothetical protein
MRFGMLDYEWFARSHLVLALNVGLGPEECHHHPGSTSHGSKVQRSSPRLKNASTVSFSHSGPNFMKCCHYSQVHRLYDRHAPRLYNQNTDNIIKKVV